MFNRKDMTKIAESNWTFVTIVIITMFGFAIKLGWF